MIRKNIKVNPFIWKKGDIVMMVRQFAAVSGALALIVGLCVSQPLLAGDAQTANKPSNMITLISVGYCEGGPFTTYNRYGSRVMDDLSLTQFTIPPGYKFIVTSSTHEAYAVIAGVGRRMVEAGLNVDTAIPSGAVLCVSGSASGQIHGHLEKDIP